MSRPRPSIWVVNACLRDGAGGSPTVVLDDAALTDAGRTRIPPRFGASHAVFMHRASIVGLRFFTASGELPACGHGTIAALAVLAQQRRGRAHEFHLRVSGRIITGHTVRDGDRVNASFEPGPVTLRTPTAAETDPVYAALGIPSDPLDAGARIASLGRERMLVPVATPAAVAALTPDLDRLRVVCDGLGLLGCYVHSTPTGAGRVVARMFAPSIGVPEDVANANSTACLAAHLGQQGITDLTVDMGDALGTPATITATVAGRRVLVGGAATVTREAQPSARGGPGSSPSGR